MNSLQKHLCIKAPPVSTDVQSVGEPWKRVTDFGLILVIDQAITVDVRIPGISRMISDLIRQISSEVGQGFCIGLVYTFILIAPQRKQRQSFITQCVRSEYALTSI